MALSAVIGLEVHAQLPTASKLFCPCSTAFGGPPNTHVCPVCLGLPGALPSPNGRAMELAARAALSLDCRVHGQSVFARKSYFYPDLAKGYQISQHDRPLATDGSLRVGDRAIRIRRLHVEEDAAKNLHGHGDGRTTAVDFNRAGVPLVEIVSEPDLRSAEEAESYLRLLRETLLFAGVNDGNLEEGSFRCDANVSLMPEGSAELGTRTELKNINSFRFVRQAIEAEIERQREILSSGGRVVQETRGWDEESGTTAPMRSKEEAEDYRYFPDPDLPPLCLADEDLERIRSELPEGPERTRARWRDDLGLTEHDATVLSSHPALATFFDAVVVELGATSAKRAANFVQAELLRHVRTDGLGARIPETPRRIAELLALEADGTISTKGVKQAFAGMLETGSSAADVVAARGLRQISDEATLRVHVDAVLDAHPEQLAAYRGGKDKLFGFFVGQVMKATGGAASPDALRAVLTRRLKADD